MKPIIVTDQRAEKLKRTISKRQNDITIILENVHDPHNLGAVLRTCDSIGLLEIYALYTKENAANLKSVAGRRSSSGARKWVDVHYYKDASLCIDDVRKKYKTIYGTHLAQDAVGLYDLKLDQSVALVFGNENRGISKELLSFLDGNFIIPQVGLVQSLNISVACAVTLYEAKRQRLIKGKYDMEFDANNIHHVALFEKYQEK
ncbi:MAG: RNA methyltransferase [Saprospiraceae bacterium]